MTGPFGLVEVDQPGPSSAAPEPSLAWLGRIAAANALVD